mmetsp:Transcript_26751/g.42385  ORF Transcript_26751/g.42385 Transcript_26751/m.42385 type:complete len:258 (-) Transcript_26751:503-1276(-)
MSRNLQLFLDHTTFSFSWCNEPHFLFNSAQRLMFGLLIFAFRQLSLLLLFLVFHKLLLRRFLLQILLSPLLIPIRSRFQSHINLTRSRRRWPWRVFRRLCAFLLLRQLLDLIHTHSVGRSFVVLIVAFHAVEFRQEAVPRFLGEFGIVLEFLLHHQPLQLVDRMLVLHALHHNVPHLTHSFDRANHTDGFAVHQYVAFGQQFNCLQCDTVGSNESRSTANKAKFVARDIGLSYFDDIREDAILHHFCCMFKRHVSCD